MTDVMTVNELCQIGPEVTPGTAVAATKKLQAAMYQDTPKLDTHAYGPQGEKYDELVEPGNEQTEFKISGPPTFDELVYLICGMFGKVTPTIPPGGTNSRQWDWIPALTGPYTPQTYTVERGQMTRARKYPFVVGTGLTLTTSRDKCEMAADAFGGAMQDNITLTAGTALVNLVPILGEYFNLYLDPTSAALGTTQMQSAFQAVFAWTGGYKPVFTLNRATTSFSKIADQKPKAECKLTLEADAQGMALLPILRAGSYQYMRLQAIGPIIEGTIAYTLTIDAAIKLNAPAPFKDQDGLVAVEWPFTIVKDPNWNSGQAFHITLINTLQSL